MARYAPLALPLNDLPDHEVAPRVSTVGNPPARSLFARIFDALIEARQRQADREVARLLEGYGGKLTDSVEREIIDRLAPHAGHSSSRSVL
jgi:hypothetical protein